MNFDSVLDDIDLVLADVRLALSGKPVENQFADEGESDEYCMGAMDVYESIDHAIDLLIRMKHEIISTHVNALEAQLQNKLEKQ
jgi:hypothetical protein